MIPALKDVVQWLQGFVGFLNSLPEGVKKTIVVIALLAGALGPVLIVVGKVISSIGTILTILPKLAGVIGIVQKAFTALHVTMLANPIALIVVAITALVAVFIYLWNTSGEFSKFWTNVWNSIKDTATSVVNGLKSAVGGAFSSMWSGIRSTVSGIYHTIRDGLGQAVVL